MCCGIRGISLFHSHYRNINSSEVVTVTLLHIRDQDHLVLDYFPDQPPPHHQGQFLTTALMEISDWWTISQSSSDTEAFTTL